MRSFMLAIVALVTFSMLTPEASAWPWRSNRGSVVNKYSSPQAAAADKAERQAAACRMDHLGVGYGGGNAEGIGRGETPAKALAICCYTGQRVCLAAEVRQGRDGWWYACKIFQ